MYSWTWASVVGTGFVAADCKLPLALVCVLSVASRANAKSLHALWPIRERTACLRQSERHVPDAPIRTRELSSRLSGQMRNLTHRRVTLTNARLTQHQAHGCIISQTSFRPHYLSLARVPLSLRVRQRDHVIGCKTIITLI